MLSGGDLPDGDAFVDGPRLTMAGAPAGPLAGLAFAAKDIFDIAGHVTGCGSPDWRATHGPATATASAVSRLLAAGARLVGKTRTDEIAFSLFGENHHYGTPLNPAARGRVPGGSSSGSASATAQRLVDFALGSDTGGSVRAPASFCGIWGLRPTHGAVAIDNVMPLAPSFDTVGWFARSPGLLERVGRVLLPEAEVVRPSRLLACEEAFAMLAPQLRAGLLRAASLAGAALAPITPVRIGLRPLDEWRRHFQTLQLSEVWRTHGDWVSRTRPRFGPGVRERFAAAARVEEGAVSASLAFRAEATQAMAALLEPGTFLMLPTVPGPAPLKGPPAHLQLRLRNAALSILAIAGLARLPQLSMPLAQAEDAAPVGLSLVGRPGSDRSLLAAAVRVGRAQAS